ncbi:hypothetical protein HALA3H3_830121 [Halomonas sp. A3H3]|nr:hypothetical protein HALA3H3_830121 [Halomonas sp. A3H3]
MSTWRSNQLSYGPEKGCGIRLVEPGGFEPPTSTMSTWRSNQLSYGSIALSVLLHFLRWAIG